MTRRFLVCAALVCALGAPVGGLLATPASAAGGSQVISDCNTHGRLTQRYSVSQLRAALGTMPADVKEYTDCYDVIQRTLFAQLSSTHVGGSGKSSSGGSFLPTPLIVVLAVLVVGALGLGAVALSRRNRVE